MDSQCVLVFFGPTQAGKSTTVKFLTESMTAHDAFIKIGDGDGHSVTTHAQLYEATKLGIPVLDTPGINDSKLRWTNQQAGARVAVEALSVQAEVLKFIVVDSLGNDSMQLHNTLESLVLAFGHDILKGTVVLATKADLKRGESLQRRITSVKKAAAKQGIQQVVVWQNEEISEGGQAAQLQNLTQALQRVTGVATKDLKDLNARVKLKAQELHAEAPPETQEVTVTEQYLDSYTDQEEYNQDYIAWVDKPKEVSEWVPTKKEVKVDVDMPYIKRQNFFQRLFKSPEMEYKTKTVRTTVDTFEEKRVEKMEKVPEVKQQVAQRPVTKYQTKSKDVVKTVEYSLPVQHFQTVALTQITGEVRQALASQVFADDDELEVGTFASDSESESWESRPHFISRLLCTDMGQMKINWQSRHCFETAF